VKLSTYLDPVLQHFTDSRIVRNINQMVGFFKPIRFEGEDNLTLFSRQTSPINGKSAEKSL